MRNPGKKLPGIAVSEQLVEVVAVSGAVVG